MKLLKVLFLMSIISITNVSKTHAGLGAVASIFNPAVGIPIALTGLGLTTTGYIRSKHSTGPAGNFITAYLFFFPGLILLDEEQGKIEFGEIDNEVAKNLGVEESIAGYNEDLPELNLVFDEYLTEVSKGLNVDQATELWNDLKSNLSDETNEVLEAMKDIQ